MCSDSTVESGAERPKLPTPCVSKLNVTRTHFGVETRTHTRRRCIQSCSQSRAPQITRVRHAWLCGMPAQCKNRLQSGSVVSERNVQLNVHWLLLPGVAARETARPKCTQKGNDGARGQTTPHTRRQTRAINAPQHLISHQRTMQQLLREDFLLGQAQKELSLHNSHFTSKNTSVATNKPTPVTFTKQV